MHDHNRHMLPLPTIANIPPYEGAEALCDMLDREFDRWFHDAFQIEWCRDPARAPAQFLNAMGDEVAADILEDDTERTKRLKILMAQDINRRRGFWVTIKELIDAFVGDSASMLPAFVREDFPIQGDSQSSHIVVDGEDVDATVKSFSGFPITAMALYSDSSIVYSSGGVIRIDVGSSSLTEEQVEILKGILSSQVCCYFIVYLGYMQAGSFVPYPNGRMG